jgi:hypothetical protein
MPTIGEAKPLDFKPTTTTTTESSFLEREERERVERVTAERVPSYVCTFFAVLRVSSLLASAFDSLSTTESKKGKGNRLLLRFESITNENEEDTSEKTKIEKICDEKAKTIRKSEKKVVK